VFVAEGWVDKVLSQSGIILLQHCPLYTEMWSFVKFYTWWVRTTVTNFLLVDQSTQDNTATWPSVCGFQRTFLIDNVLFHSEDICH